MKRILTLTACLLLLTAASAQPSVGKQSGRKGVEVDVSVRPVIDTSFFTLPDLITDEYLDSVGTAFDQPINDYVLFGFHGGAVFNNTYFNPPWEAKFSSHAPVFGASLTIHGKLFGFMPYFGLEIGAQHTFEGYSFKENKETKITRNLEGAEDLVMEVWEVPFLMAAHADLGENFKLLAKVGIYGGYRTNVQRSGTYLESSYYSLVDYNPDMMTTVKGSYPDRYYPSLYEPEFRDKWDLRWTYGLEGGVGFGIMLSPVEFHVNALVKWGWGSFFAPNYYSKYYYRFGYPLDVMVTAGLYYQLTPRRGYTRHRLKKYAHQIVYGE